MKMICIVEKLMYIVKKEVIYHERTFFGASREGF